MQDQGPMMVNEALACSIPVLSFKISVAVNFIKKNYNGFLIKKISSKFLAKKILEISILKINEITHMKKNSRITANRFINLSSSIENIIRICK